VTDAQTAQPCLGPVQVAGGLQPLVDPQGSLQQWNAGVHPARACQGRARVFAGQSQLQRTGAPGNSVHGREQDLGIALEQSLAAQCRAGQPGNLVAGRQVRDRGRHLPRPCLVVDGQRQADQIGPERRVLDRQA
jgi:hypothetical protein